VVPVNPVPAGPVAPVAPLYPVEPVKDPAICNVAENHVPGPYAESGNKDEFVEFVVVATNET
jgi:hypothetical protein